MLNQSVAARKIRLTLSAVGLGLWAAYELWLLFQIKFVELGNALVGFLILAAPFLLYIVAVRRLAGSLVVGPILLATRVWIAYVLETSTSSTASLVVIPALFIDLVAIGGAVVAEQLRILFSERKFRTSAK